MISQEPRGIENRKSSADRRFRARRLQLSAQPDRDVILSVLSHVVAETADKMGVARVEIQGGDVPVASKVLAVNPADVKGILYCRPPVAALLHAGPRIAQQLSELRGLTMFGQKVHAVVLVSEPSAAGSEPTRLTQSQTGWPASALAVVPTPHPVTVQDRPSMTPSSSSLPSTKSPNLRGSGHMLPYLANADATTQTELLLGFLVSLQSYALASPDQHVLHVSQGEEQITPQVLLYLSVSAHILRKQFMPSSSQHWGTSCEGLQEDLFEDDNPMYQQAYFNELWFIPARGVAQGHVSAGATEQLLDSTIGSALASERVDFAQVSISSWLDSSFCLLTLALMFVCACWQTISCGATASLDCSRRTRGWPCNTDSSRRSPSTAWRVCKTSRSATTARTWTCRPSKPLARRRCGMRTTLCRKSRVMATDARSCRSGCRSDPSCTAATRSGCRGFGGWSPRTSRRKSRLLTTSSP
jgi:hypothetical protein